MVEGLTTTQKTTTKFSQTFGDVAVGPQKDGQFPSTKVGLSAGTYLLTVQPNGKQLVTSRVRSSSAYAARLLAKWPCLFIGQGHFVVIKDGLNVR